MKRKLLLKPETLRHLGATQLAVLRAGEAAASVVWCLTQRETCACSDGYSCSGSGRD